MRRKTLIVFLILFAAIGCWGQSAWREKDPEFSACLGLYNQGRYAQAVEHLESWALTHQPRKTKAFYFIGASYYMMGLKEQNKQLAANLFTRSADFYHRSDSEEENPRFRLDARLREAWSYFRKAEVSTLFREPLLEAMNSFMQVARSKVDVKIATDARYMAGESALLIAHSLMLERYNGIGELSGIKVVEEYFDTAISSFDAVGKSSFTTPELQYCAQFRKNDALLQRGIFYGCTDPSSLENLGHSNREALIRSQFQQADYHTLQNINNGPYRALAIYSQAVKELFNYILLQDQGELSNTLSSLGAIPQYRREKTFIEGMRDFRTDVEDVVFKNLYQNENSLFSRLTGVMPEAWYWMGWTNFISQPSGGERFFQSYLDKTENDKLNVRINALREDALYHIYRIQFDRYAGNAGQMKILAERIRNWSPSNRKVIEFKRTLLLLIEGVGSEEAGNNILLIRELLNIASLKFGMPRLHYIEILKKILERPDTDQQQSFFLGLTKIKEAEIQDTPLKKKQLYDEASTYFNRVREGELKDEALYTQAVAHYEETRRTTVDSEKNRLYNKAINIFIGLVNEKQSVRALYYLAVVCREQGDHVEAKKYYERIVSVASDMSDNDQTYWRNKALAGLKLCTDMEYNRKKGLIKTNALNKIVWKKTWMEIRGIPVSLEKLASRDFLKKRYQDDALELFKEFGHPPLSIYPAKTIVRNSRFSRSKVSDIKAGFDVRVAVSSGLELHVQTSRLTGTERDFSVSLDNAPITPDEHGLFIKRPVDYDHRGELKIVGPGYYPHRDTIHFTEPNIQTETVTMMPELVFTRDDAAGGAPESELVRFENRLDKNAAFLEKNLSVGVNTELYRHFNAEFRMRDVFFKDNYFLVVQSNSPNLVRYQNNANLSRLDLFNLRYDHAPMEMISPENGATDSEGHLYISDMGSHLIYVFQANGDFLYTIGSSDYRANSVGESIRLSYPSLLAVADESGRDPVIFIMDRKGLHLISSKGIYWAKIDLGDRDSGGYAAMTVEGYGQNMQLYLVKRSTGELVHLKASLKHK